MWILLVNYVGAVSGIVWVGKVCGCRVGVDVGVEHARTQAGRQASR